MAIRRVPYRGGNWNNGERAGVSYVNLNNPRSNSNTNRGARPLLKIKTPESITHGLLDSANLKGRIIRGENRNTKQAGYSSSKRDRLHLPPNKKEKRNG